MQATVTRVDDNTITFVSADEQRTAVIKVRDHRIGRTSSYHAKLSNGREIGGEISYSMLFNLCARWVVDGPPCK